MSSLMEWGQIGPSFSFFGLAMSMPCQESTGAIQSTEASREIIFVMEYIRKMVLHVCI